jgi:hypothetical protein
MHAGVAFFILRAVRCKQEKEAFIQIGGCMSMVKLHTVLTARTNLGQFSTRFLIIVIQGQALGKDTFCSNNRLITNVYHHIQPSAARGLPKTTMQTSLILPLSRFSYRTARNALISAQRSVVKG